MHRVVALVIPQVVAFDLAVPAQVFGHSDESDRYRFSVCASAPGVLPTTTGFGLSVGLGLEAIATADTVIIPGYSPHDEPIQATLDALRTAAKRGARLVSICTGAFALAAAGLLNGLRATTHWRDAPELLARYPLIKVDADVLYVDDAPVMTSAGIAAGIDLCIQIVRADHGEVAAAEVARRMVVAPHRAGGQAQFLHRPIPPRGTGLATTCAWALEHLDTALSVADLARHAGWSPRTFARHFVEETGVSPQRWITAHRVLEARRLLEATDMSIDQIADRTGLGTAANLRLHLARDTGTTPSMYRRAYRGQIRAPQASRAEW